MEPVGFSGGSGGYWWSQETKGKLLEKSEVDVKERDIDMDTVERIQHGAIKISQV